MHSFYNAETWLKSHWITLIMIIIIVVTIIVLPLIIIWLIKKINNQKASKKIWKIWKDKNFSTTSLINTFMNDVNIKFWQIEIKHANSNKKIAWFALIDIWTRVIANKYDKDYGNPKEALSSLYIFYKELRVEIKKYPAAFKSNIVILAFMNNELRPFLTKWNFLINEEFKDLEKTSYINEFIKDFDLMYESIIQNKYIENLLIILGLNINHKNITITNGVENLKKKNDENKQKEISSINDLLKLNSSSEKDKKNKID